MHMNSYAAKLERTKKCIEKLGQTTKRISQNIILSMDSSNSWDKLFKK